MNDRRFRLGLAALAAGLVLVLAGTAFAGGSPDLELQLVASGFVRPLALRHAGDNTGRLFIVEQRGRILIFDQVTGTVLPTPFLDIQTTVDDAANEQGLLGLAFHPDFKRNGLFYVNYTRDPGPGLDRTVIRRYKVSTTNPNQADLSTATTLLEVEQPFSNHNGGNILFGPDGYLYIGMGDGGSGNDPLANAQNKNSLLGKMLRIDVDGEPDPGDVFCGLSPNGYGIPDDNPFVGATTGCDEIWTYGMRNPWRYSFDRQSGDLYIADVGQGAREEIDFKAVGSAGGNNYGWPCREGFIGGPGACDGAPLVDPIFDYVRSLGISVTGGYLYRGPLISLRGTYIMGDYVTGRIWFGDGLPGSQSFTVWSDTPYSIPSFGEDQIGNVYITTFAGTVYRFGLPASTGAGRVPDGKSASTPLTVNPGVAGQLELAWGLSCNGADSDYAVYEGALGDFESHKKLLCSTGGQTDATITPNAGDKYYLIVPHNTVREGSHGANSFGLERAVGSASCFEQALAGCP